MSQTLTRPTAAVARAQPFVARYARSVVDIDRRVFRAAPSWSHCRLPELQAPFLGVSPAARRQLAWGPFLATCRTGGGPGCVNR